MDENIFTVIVDRLSIQSLILKRHIKYCFKINGKQRNKITKKSEFVQFKNYERKINLLYTIYADFEIILVPEDNGKAKSKWILY